MRFGLFVAFRLVVEVCRTRPRDCASDRERPLIVLQSIRICAPMSEVSWSFPEAPIVSRRRRKRTSQGRGRVDSHPSATATLSCLAFRSSSVDLAMVAAARARAASLSALACSASILMRRDRDTSLCARALARRKSTVVGSYMPDQIPHGSAGAAARHMLKFRHRDPYEQLGLNSAARKTQLVNIAVASCVRLQRRLKSVLLFIHPG